MPSHPIAVLFSAGLDSAVLLAHAADENAATAVQPVYVRAGLAWEGEERAMAERLLGSAAYAGRMLPLVTLTVDMRDVYPPMHWAVRGEPPAYDTPDEDVYLEGRNVVLLSKTSVFMARAGISRVMIGPLAGNPFPDATRTFFDAMEIALSIGLAASVNAAWLLWGLRRRGSYLPQPGWLAFIWRVALASLVMAAGMVVAAWRIDWIAMGANEALRAGAMALALSLSAALYFGLLRLLGLDLRQLLRRRV